MIEKIVGDQVTKDSCCPELDYKTRILGFIITAGIGVGGLFVSFMLAFSPTLMGLVFTCSSIGILLSTFFMVGPKKQWENMMKPQRMVASIIYLCSIVLLLLGVFGIGGKLLMYVFIVIHLCALVWYVLSYIPFAQKCCETCMKSCLKGGGGESEAGIL